MTEVYKTKDLYEAAFLYALKNRLSGTENENGDVVFVFADSGKNCEKLVESFRTKQGTVVGRDYAEAVKTLKAMIYALKDQN